MALKRVLAIDAGTTRLNAVVFDAAGRVCATRSRAHPPSHPAPGRVEIDARALGQAVVALCEQVLEEAGPVEAVGIASQRASCVVWDRASGEPVAPGQGWQDLRVLERCVRWRARGVLLAPNQSAAKLLDILDVLAAESSEGRRDLCFGTVDAWLGWVLSDGACHATDPSSACATGLLEPVSAADAAAPAWNAARLETLGISEAMLPTLHDTAEALAPAVRLPGAPLLAARVGDQQASLLGQGALARGDAKLTCGTSAMLDLNLGRVPAPFEDLGPAGTFPIVAWRVGGETCHALEASELCAGGCLDWLCDLGLLSSPAESHALAASCADSRGVVFVPALAGLGTPYWDPRARGALLGLTRGSGRAEIARAVLEGLAARCADLVEALEADSGVAIPVLRADGGLTANPSFLRALADAVQRPVEVSQPEATARGAALLAGHAVGLWPDLARAASEAVAPRRIEPGAAPDRERWLAALERVR